MSRWGVWSYGVLGEVMAARAGEAVAIPASKPQLLLALLAIRPNQVVAAEQLIDELWSGDPPESARTLLHGYVSDLRSILEPERAPRAPATILRTQPPGYILSCHPEDVDAMRFEHLVRRAREAFQHQDIAAARRSLEEALDLWRGDPFGPVGDAPTLQPARARLEQLHLSAVEDRVMLDLRDGQDAILVMELERLVTEHPLRERLWAALMLALYRSGRQADALAAYQRIAQLLRDELGTGPGAELARTHAAILRHEADLETAPRTARITRPPRATAPLVGRREALARLHDAVGEHRLVTLTGPGGCGKTRLVQELARSLEPAGPVAWVDLASTRDAAEVAATTMAALGVVEQPQRDPLDTLVAQVADRQLVAVLDTCEHQLAACCDLARTLLQGCTGVRILATSRTALQLPGEVRWPVPPLEVPAEDADHATITATAAVQLFLDRAREARPGFTLAPRNAGDVAAICRHVDGIPLAVELAAAWVAVMGLPAIREQLADPLGFLTRGSPSAPARQQTLRATIDWSHRLLEDRDRRLFAQLSVFAGAFPIAAATDVCRAETPDDAVAGDEDSEVPAKTAILVGLANLQAASLLTARHDADGTARFRMLDTIRQFGQEQLAATGQSDTLHERHSRYVHDLACDAERGLYGPELQTWLARLDDAHADIRTALGWALSRGQPALALDVAGALSRFWMARAHIAEGRRWLRRALDADNWHQPSARVRALLTASFLASLHYDLDEARTTSDEALTLVRAAKHVRGTAWALAMVALAAAMAGDAEGAVAATQQALQLPGISEDPLVRAWELNFMALGYQAGGHYEDQRDVLAESLQLCRRARDPMGVEWALGYGGSAAHALGQRSDALRMLRESLTISRSLGNSWGMARNLAAVALASDDTEVRYEQMRESLRTFGLLGDRAGVAFCLRAIAGWAADRARPVEAATLKDAANEIGGDVRQVPVLGHLPTQASSIEPVAAAGSTPTGKGVLSPLTIEGAVMVGTDAVDRLGEPLRPEDPDPRPAA